MAVPPRHWEMRASSSRPSFAGPGPGTIEIEGRLESRIGKSPLVGRTEARNGIEHRIAGRMPEAAVAHLLQDGFMCSISAKSYGDPWPLASFVHQVLQQRGADRHGVQKPQLSCAKKCVKLRATSNMSRVASKTMKARRRTSSKRSGGRIRRFVDAGARRTTDLHRLRSRGTAGSSTWPIADAERNS